MSASIWMLCSLLVSEAPDMGVLSSLGEFPRWRKVALLGVSASARLTWVRQIAWSFLLQSYSWWHQWNLSLTTPKSYVCLQWKCALSTLYSDLCELARPVQICCSWLPRILGAGVVNTQPTVILFFPSKRQPDLWLIMLIVCFIKWNLTCSLLQIGLLKSTQPNHHSHHHKWGPLSPPSQYCWPQSYSERGESARKGY